MVNVREGVITCSFGKFEEANELKDPGCTVLSLSGNQVAERPNIHPVKILFCIIFTHELILFRKLR
jgi:hypothetical protein